MGWEGQRGGVAAVAVAAVAVAAVCTASGTA